MLLDITWIILALIIILQRSYVTAYHLKILNNRQRFKNSNIFSLQDILARRP